MYNPLFEQINNDNKLIKNSVLKQYIEFSENFDPFFMKQYELMKSFDSSVDP